MQDLQPSVHAGTDKILGRFNETFLHCIAFAFHPKGFHCAYRELDRESTSPKCDQCISNNTAYNRIILLGKIMAQRERDVVFLGYQKTLGDALTTFRTTLTHSGASFSVTKSQLNKIQVGCYGSLNAMFADQVNIVFCDAVIMLFRITHRGTPYGFWCLDEICYRKAKFWLQNLACYLGDADLLKHYSSDGGNETANLETTSIERNSEGTPLTKVTDEYEDLLAMLATRGHESMLQRMLLCSSSPRTNLVLSLCGAFYSGNTQILDMILTAIPVDQVTSVCSRSLHKVCAAWDMPLNYSTLAEQVLNHCAELPDDKSVGWILTTQANLGAARTLRSLLHRLAGRSFRPYSRPEWRTRMSPLWAACLDGNLECFRSLLDGGYLTDLLRRKDAVKMCADCLQAAAYGNSLPLYQELCRFLGKDVEKMNICHLAAIEGSIDLMSEKFAVKPKLLDLKEKPYQTDEHTVGEAALKSALKRLRVENVEFFLKRGVRSDSGSFWSYFSIRWEDRRNREEEFQRVQELLRQYGVKELRTFVG